MSQPPAAAPPSPLPQPIFEGQVDVNLIDPEPDQPRRHFERGDRDGLEANIRAKGILQSLLLRPSPKKRLRYLVVAGERRFRAAKAIGLQSVPARVFELSDRDAQEIGLIENIQRQDLHPMEEAETFARLQKLDKAYTDQAIAERIGKSVRYVQQRKRLLSLPDVARDAFLADVITDAHASILVKIPDELKDRAFAECFLDLEDRAVTADRIRRRAWDELRDQVAAPASLQNFVDLSVQYEPAELQERLPELEAATAEASAKGTGLVQLSGEYTLSPSDKKRTPGLLGRVDYDEVGPTARHWDKTFKKLCDKAERGVVVHRGRPRLLTFCRTGNGCPVHHPDPRAASADSADTSNGSRKNRKPTAYELAEKKRNQEQRQYVLLRSAALRAMVPCLMKATVTPALVKGIIKTYELKEIATRFGLEPKGDNGVAVLLAAAALEHLYSRSVFAKFGKLVGFDLGKFQRQHEKRKKAEQKAAAKPVRAKGKKRATKKATA